MSDNVPCGDKRNPPANTIIAKKRGDEWDTNFKNIAKDTKGISQSLSVIDSKLKTVQASVARLSVMVGAFGTVCIILQALILAKLSS